MYYSRKLHWQFLEEELTSQTEAFNRKVGTSASYLLHDTGELFVGMFLSIKENGEMILKMSNERPLPRKGEYLYCMSMPRKYTDFRNWGEMTYGDLIRNKTDFSEIVCIWQSPSDDPRFSLVGFRGMNLEFAQYIMDYPNAILVMGPTKPPYEYIANLQEVIKNTSNENISDVLDSDYEPSAWEPVLLDLSKNIPGFLLTQLNLTDNVILQGPPGTGKTFLIAEICRILAYQGKTVLVTAMTNRALIEIALKPSMQQLLSDHKVFKTNLTLDEANECRELQSEKSLTPKPGCIELGTFFITSGLAKGITGTPPFDYVIMDEASQALLGMFAVTKALGRKNLWIGDVRQLPPVVEINEDRISRKKYSGLVHGLQTITERSALPIFQLLETRRLSERASAYTSIFYQGHLKSIAKPFQPVSGLNLKEGPCLLTTDMKIGDSAPASGTSIARSLVQKLLDDKSIKIAVLTCMVKTAKELQKAIFGRLNSGHSNVTIETVARVQGLTCDVTIYVVPNASLNRSLEPRLFNVATSRAIRHTIIIAEKEIVQYPLMDSKVKQYLKKLEQEQSCYIPFNCQTGPKLLNSTNNNLIELQ